MKFISKKTLAVAAGLALSSASAFASHIPGFSFGPEPFIVNPTAVGESFAPFTAGAINFSYTSENDQFGGSGSGSTATANFNETGFADFGAFLTSVGGASIPAGTTGLNLGPGAVGYTLYALFSGGGTVTPGATGGIEGTFNAFNVTFFVDRDNNTTFGPVGGDDFGTRLTAVGNVGDDVSVLTGTLAVGGFHAFAGLAAGDFDVVFNITGFGDAPGFFSTTSTGEPLTQGDFNGVNSFIDGIVVPPPGSFTDATIRGSGNVTFQGVPEPTSLALVGLALLGLGATARRKQG